MVGLSRFELLTPRLSSVCSNQLSYRPSSPLLPAVASHKGPRPRAGCVKEPDSAKAPSGKPGRLAGRNAARGGRFFQN